MYNINIKLTDSKQNFFRHNTEKYIEALKVLTYNNIQF